MSRLLLLLMLLLAGCEQAPEPRPAAPPKPAAPVSTAIEREMVLVKNTPMVQVRINDQGPFWFTVDTGAGYPCGISKRLASKLGLYPTGRINARAGGRVKEVHTTRLGKLTLGVARFDDVPALMMDSAGFRRALGDRFDGILGFPLFAEWLLTLDYPRKRLVLDIGRLGPPDGGERVRMQLWDRTPAVVVETSRYKIPIMLDTGNSLGLTLYSRMARRLALAYPPEEGPRSMTLHGRVATTYSRLEDDLIVGGHRVGRPRVWFLLDHASLGGEVLRRFRITFDQSERVVRFEMP